MFINDKLFVIKSQVVFKYLENFIFVKSKVV